MNNIMSNNGNYRGLSIIDSKETELPLLERIYAEVDKANMSIPAEPDKQFFKDQKRVYAHLFDPCLSYSGPTSMGKSFIMRMFIKEHIQVGDVFNYVILVPTKALINEVYSKITQDLTKSLAEHDYKIVTSAGSIALKGFCVEVHGMYNLARFAFDGKMIDEIVMPSAFNFCQDLAELQNEKNNRPGEIVHVYPEKLDFYNRLMVDKPVLMYLREEGKKRFIDTGRYLEDIMLENNMYI